MKRLNIDIIIKILILLGFSAFYLEIIATNEIMMYVHPRIIPFAIFGVMSMLIIAIILITSIFSINKKRLKVKNYIAFIIPLALIFFIQSTNANSAMKTNDLSSIENSNASSDTGSSDVLTNNSNENTNLNSSTSTFELYSGKTESDGQDTIDRKELDIKNNIIQVNSKSFVFSLDEILGNPDKYDGKEIEITGFVYRDKNLKENEFIIGRFMMVCCAADMQIAGIRCDGNNLKSYSNDTWIKIQGKIKKDTYEGQVDPLIIVEHIERDLNPDTSYVYPF